jgi:hypothetical protein
MRMPGFTAALSSYESSGKYWQNPIRTGHSQGVVSAQTPSDYQIAACSVACAAKCIGVCFWDPEGSTCIECVDRCMGSCAGS